MNNLSTATDPSASKNALRVAIVMIAFLVASSAFAEGIPLQIETPTSGEQVASPFVVSGRAEPGSLLELWVGDELERVFRASASGRFSAPVLGEVPPDASIWVHRVDHDAERIESASIGVLWSGTKPTFTETPRVAEATPDAPRAPPANSETGTVDVDATDSVVMKTPIRERPRGSRILVESIGGAAGGFLGGLVGALLGLGVGIAAAPNSYAFIATAVVGGIAGWTSGLVAGVTLGGHLMGGTGKWWGTLLGTVAGAAVAGVVGGGLHAALWAPEVLAIGLVILPIGGAVVGYEWTAKKPDGSPAMSVSISPVVAPAADGGIAKGAGVTVRF